MATEKQLPFGQITPVAKPLGSFITPGQKQTAGAAKPSLIGSVPQIATLQRGSQGNVQGYNQFQQLADALGPFTQNLVKAGAAVYENYARTNMEIGRKNTPEYLEARNQLEKAKLSLQVQQEKGLADSMSAIDVLRKTDPDAAALLEVTNPWRLTGRRKFLSQMMAAEVDNKFEDYLNNNQLELSKLPTDHPEIAKAQHQIITKLQDKYGLTGDEPEYARYVIGAENKARDSFRDSHETIYNEALDISTEETAVASFQQQLGGILKDGLPVINSETNEQTLLFPGQTTQEKTDFAYLTGKHLTALLDDKLKLLGGKRRKKVLDKIISEVAGVYANDPIATEAIKFIKTGSQLDDFDKRPMLFQTMPTELLEMQNKGLEEQTKAIELQEKVKEDALDNLWYAEGGPGQQTPGTEDYKKSLTAFYERAKSINYRNVDEYIVDRNKDFSGLVGLLQAPSKEEISDFKEELRTLEPEVFEGGRKDLFERIKKFALPMNDGGKLERELINLVNDRQKYLSKNPQALNQIINQRLPEFIDEKIKPPNLGRGGVFGSYMEAINATGNRKAIVFSNKFKRGAEKIFKQKQKEWFKETGQTYMPESIVIDLSNEAVDDFASSDQFTKIYEEATKQPEKREEVKIDPKQIKQDSRNQPVGLVGSENVPDRVVKRYRERAVLNATWLYNELNNLNQGKELSPQLKQFATRAKTSPERYLLEQLRFYRGPNNEYTFDPDGSVRKYLEGLVNNKKSTDQASLTYFNKAMASAISPGPGDWMLNMLFGGPVNAEPMPTATGLTTGDNNQRFQSAVALAKKLGAKYPEVVAAQFALESGFGNKPSGTNNFFGLKALPGTKGSLVNTEEDDASGKSKKVKANFINFDSEEKSFKYLIDKWYKDYKSFTGVESGKSVKEVTNLLQQQGYATDPNYAKTLQTLVQEYSIGG